MMPRIVAGEGDLLIIVDHASNHVPTGVELGIDPALLDQHMAIDIGAKALGALLAERLGARAIFATVSRLVIDLNREEDAAGLIPLASDGHEVPGNAALSEAERLDRVELYWRPYHDAIAGTIAASPPKLIISLHSFTPRLTSDPEKKRPWEIGILYNRDDRAARIAIPLLEAAGVVTGDNLPYSGKVLNATMNRHAERNGLAYLGIEVRQDLILDTVGVARWADILAPVIAQTRNSLA